jgi:hypothetical protein
MEVFLFFFALDFSSLNNENIDVLIKKTYSSKYINYADLVVYSYDR